MAAAKKNKGGRPKSKIDPEAVERLAAVGCSGEEIATTLGCSRETLYARFSDSLEKGHTHQRVSLRQKQYQLALEGDRTMLVWLGKQYLGQKDKREETYEQIGVVQVEVIRDGDWYGNAARLAACGVGSPGNGAQQSGKTQVRGVRPKVGKDGNGPNGNGRRARK